MLGTFCTVLSGPVTSVCSLLLVAPSKNANAHIDAHIKTIKKATTIRNTKCNRYKQFIHMRSAMFFSRLTSGKEKIQEMIKLISDMVTSG